MILAAGRGERLRPLTDTIPKPLITVGNHRLVEYHIQALEQAGIRRVIINLAHLGRCIEDALGDGSSYGVEILYSREPEGALETAGGIHHALPLLGDAPFLVINGDIRCDHPLDSLAISANMEMHLVLVPNPAHNPRGDFSIADDAEAGPLRHPAGGSATHTFAGLGVYRPAAFRGLDAGPAPLAPLIRQCIDRGTASGEIHRGYWLDVGDHERLQQARRDARADS
jgi:MurNAc alpha-1-phosphate uridylyltransferase